MELDVIRNVIAEVLSVDPAEVTLETTFKEDLGADSLDLFQIMTGIEEELDLEVDTDAIEQITTVGEAVDLIKKTMP